MVPRMIALLAALAALSAAAPTFAILSERLFGLAPCALCLWQRWPYWVAAFIALAAMALPARLKRWAMGAAALAIAASGGIAMLHVGVEAGWWPSPLPGCRAPQAGAAMSVDDLMRSLAPAPTTPCDAPTFLVPGLPVSMAAMNLIYALALTALAASWARRRT